MNSLTKTVVPEVTFRRMTTADLGPALQIAADCADEWLWPRDEFQECVHSRDASGRVAEADGRILGFLIYRLDRSLHEVFIKNLAVAPTWRRRGIGTALVQLLDARLQQGYDRIRMVVPETSLSLQLLLRWCGYRSVRLLRGWFGTEHAYLMEKQASETE